MIFCSDFPTRECKDIRAVIHHVGAGTAEHLLPKPCVTWKDSRQGTGTGNCYCTHLDCRGGGGKKHKSLGFCIVRNALTHCRNPWAGVSSFLG